MIVTENNIRDIIGKTPIKTDSANVKGEVHCDKLTAKNADISEKVTADDAVFKTLTINKDDNPNIYLNPFSYIKPHKNTPIASPKNLVIWHTFEKLNWYLFSNLFIYTASHIFSYEVEIKIDQVIAINVITILFDTNAITYPKNLIPNFIVTVT